MSIKKFAGHSNSEEILAALPGEKIAAFFKSASYLRGDDGTEWWFVMESGYALVVRLPNGAFWIANQAETEREVSRQLKELQQNVRRLGMLGTIAILAPEETP